MHALWNGPEETIDDIAAVAESVEEGEGFSSAAEPTEPAGRLAPNMPPSGEYRPVNHGW